MSKRTTYWKRLFIRHKEIKFPKNMKEENKNRIRALCEAWKKER